MAFYIQKRAKRYLCQKAMLGQRRGKELFYIDICRQYGDFCFHISILPIFAEFYKPDKKKE